MNSWNPYKTFNLQKLEETDLFKCTQSKLREKRWYKPTLDYAEDLTKVDRVYFVTALGALLAGILLLQYGTALIVGCVGVVYPFYKTYGDLDKHDADLRRKWVLYWMLLGAVDFSETVFFFLTFIPGYWLFKSLFLIWCYAPLQRNGSEIIHGYFLRPLFQKNREAIESVVNQVAGTAHTIFTESAAAAHADTDGHHHQN